MAGTSELPLEVSSDTEDDDQVLDRDLVLGRVADHRGARSDSLPRPPPSATVSMEPPQLTGALGNESGAILTLLLRAGGATLATEDFWCRRALHLPTPLSAIEVLYARMVLVLLQCPYCGTSEMVISGRMYGTNQYKPAVHVNCSRPHCGCRACGATAQVAPVELAYTQTGAVPYFPFFLCARAQASFSLAPVVTNVGGGQYCFTLLAVPCNKTCCNVPLKKIEFNVYSSCLVPGASVSATVNGVPQQSVPHLIGPKMVRRVAAFCE
ncbi:hypothetical protein VOLCADRAFT_90439 [Volvox carteri f. nagariensis]|uniref:Pherophorin domain-containing protein n=1 Tax=Volvox carteri f. nagariensis TaxID=3068 RepID=D8TUD5_VOLCA|nr:uncharacterized protein VOLCADRAFT_90439 [Volvox carteri f. nagariensis]EFJ49019.1 hypothetical protein VOLCADRAFT_90439 [Volvox carteri f. nagariensis]|eukprot:XP_002949916.1 hypothetical protein VOLCADRAFT_90439 [Volvox carteri f. nagariensis]